MKKIYYTCITGQYDNLTPVPRYKGWRYICFTDDPYLTSDEWEIVHLDKKPKLQRHVKLCPHKFLPKHDLSVWVDGNITPKEWLDLEELIVDKNYCLMTHGCDSIKVELSNCLNRRKDDPSLMKEQVAYYKLEGLDVANSGLVATGVIIRKDNEKNRKFGERWWKEVEKWSRRDQLSFPYVAWLLDHEYETFPFLRGFKKENHVKNRYN